MMKIAIETLGCKLNQAETEKLSRQLTEAGHQLVSSVDEAEIYVLNTCTVTQTADAKSRHLLRMARRRNPSVRLVATGCYAQLAAKELTEIEGVALIAGNEEKPELAFLIDELGCEGGICAVPDLDAPVTYVSRTRSFINIQDGCSKFCSYCIVPLVRGVEKSRPANEVISEIESRVADGVKEVVLTGTEVGAYRDNDSGLKMLLERILAETSVDRVRLSSLQPHEIHSGLLETWRDPRMCPHFHISLQSGSDAVLKRMKRGYDIDRYRKTVSLIRSVMPDAAITTDVIAGFPGETDAEFDETCIFCQSIGFARLHVFPYSVRPGTEAAQLPGQVREKIKKERAQNLLALAERCSRGYRNLFSGKTSTVLWEGKSRGVWSGHTGNYIKVYVKGQEDLTNRLLKVKLGEIRGDGVWGEIVDNSRP